MSSSPESVGSARSDLSESLSRAIVRGVAGWQAVVIVGVLTSDTTVSAALVIAVHVGIGLLAMAGQRSSLIAVVAAVAAAAAVPLDLHACRSIMDPAAFTTVWTMNLLMLAPVGAIRGWRGTACGLAATLYATWVFREFQPDWTVLHGTMITTGITMVVIGTVLVRYLYRFADRADAGAADAMQVQFAVAAGRAASREAADVARTMHDTAINTLAAVASGGAATSDVRLVRERCARDVTILQNVLAGQRAGVGHTDLATIGSDVESVSIVRRGLTPTDIARASAEVPDDVLRALRSAADEAVRNAARHSGADQVTVTVRHNDGLTVEVTDTGVGFDGRITTGRGLSESVIGRASDVGAKATIRSRPGRGTSVRLTWHPEDEARPEPVDAATPLPLADSVRRWACWSWAAGVVGVGFIIEYAPRPGVFTETYIALTIVGCASLVTWALARSTVRHDHLRWWSWVLVGLVPVTFVLGYLGVEDVPYLWQALSSTPLLVILLVYRRRAAMWAAVTALAVTAFVLAGVVADGDIGRFGLVVVGAAPQLGLFAGWGFFYRVIGEVAGHSDAARREAAASRAELTAQQLVLAARNRWREVGAERTLTMLRALADGESDPQDPVVRELCAVEERALRQVMQLSPETVYLGPWLARALSDARERGVELAVRTGDVDAPGSAGADVLGRILVDRVAAEPAGGPMTIGVFGGEDGYGRLLIVGRADAAVPVVLPDGWQSRRQRLMDQELTEIVWPRYVGFPSSATTGGSDEPPART